MPLVSPQEAANQLNALGPKEVSYISSKILGAGILLGFATKVGENAANRIFPLKPVLTPNKTEAIEEPHIEITKKIAPDSLNSKESQNITACDLKAAQSKP